MAATSTATITLEYARERLAAQRGNLGARRVIAHHGRTRLDWVARGSAYLVACGEQELHRGTELAAAVTAYNEAVGR